jgi:histidine ammonia-lyase
VLQIDGRSLRLAHVVAVSDTREQVKLSAEARLRMQDSRTVVDQAVDRGAPVYGVNTGFGKLSEVTIAVDELALLQQNLVRSHAAGVGDPLPEREVRAMMLLRANVLASGYAGARPLVVDSLLAMLNAGIWPVVPEQGSVGASGDLAPLAHLAQALIGEGMARCGEREDEAARLLHDADLTPVVLAAKEGLALINGTQAHTAIAALACAELVRLWGAAHVATAMSLEALLGTPDAYDARIQEARGQEGQQTSAALLRALLEGSELRESHRHGDPRVQDAYALRCAPQVHGPAWDAIRFSRTLIERELNAATDNPLVLATGELLSGGNFHGQAVGMASDFLAIICANLAVISERRIDRLVHPDFNQGLPPFLARQPGLESGHMMSQVTAAALASECKQLAHPASVDSIPTDGNKEDVVPMAMQAAVKLRRAVRNLRHVLAIEYVAAAAALEYRRPLRSSTAVERAFTIVRTHVEPTTGDRSPSLDIIRFASALAAGAMDALTEEYRQ